MCTIIGNYINSSIYFFSYSTSLCPFYSTLHVLQTYNQYQKQKILISAGLVRHYRAVQRVPMFYPWYFVNYPVSSPSCETPPSLPVVEQTDLPSHKVYTRPNNSGSAEPHLLLHSGSAEPHPLLHSGSAEPHPLYKVALLSPLSITKWLY